MDNPNPNPLLGSTKQESQEGLGPKKEMPVASRDNAQTTTTRGEQRDSSSSRNSAAETFKAGGNRPSTSSIDSSFKGGAQQSRPSATSFLETRVGSNYLPNNVARNNSSNHSISSGGADIITKSHWKVKIASICCLYLHP